MSRLWPPGLAIDHSITLPNVWAEGDGGEYGMTDDARRRAEEWDLCIAYRWRNRDDYPDAAPCGFCGGCKAAIRKVEKIVIDAVAQAVKDEQVRYEDCLAALHETAKRAIKYEDLAREQADVQKERADLYYEDSMVMMEQRDEAYKKSDEQAEEIARLRAEVRYWKERWATEVDALRTEALRRSALSSETQASGND